MFIRTRVNRYTKYYGFLFLWSVFVNAETDLACNSSLTSRLRNDQFYATSHYYDVYNASSARKSGVGWAASSGGMFQYLQVDLEGLWEITAIDVEGSSMGWYTRTFRVSYSLDGNVWVGYNTWLSNDPLGELFERTGTITNLKLNPSIQTRFIAFNPVEAYGYPSLRLELYGCDKTSASLPIVMTRITTHIETETTWILAQSPVVIDSLVVVRPTIQVTVQAGVSIIFTTAEARMDVLGSLSLEGIPGLDVLISSNHPVLSARSKWGGLKQVAEGKITTSHTTIRQAVAGVQGHGSRIHLSKTTIHSCQYGLRLSGGLSRNYSSADKVTGMDMFLFMANIHNNEDGLQVYGKTGESGIIIGYSKFENNDGSGIRITNWESTDASLIRTDLLLVNSSLSFNLNYGIWSDSIVPCNLYIHNSSFIGNRNKGIYYYQYYPNTLNDCITISDSSFSENRFDGILITCYRCSNTNITFFNNMFSGHSQKAVDIYMDSRITGANATFLIENNIFTNNMQDIYTHVQSYVQTIFVVNNGFFNGRLPLKLKSNDLDNNKAVISGNNFTNTSAQSLSDIAIEIDGVTTNVTSNSFHNCSTPYLITLQKGFGHSVSFNKFLNTSSSLCYLKLEEAYDPNKYIVLDNNFWGTSEKLSLKSKVCDFFHDSKKIIAVLNNFYPTAQMETPLSSSDIDTFRYERNTQTNGYLVGGVIDKDTDLLFLDGETLIVNRSILIINSPTVILGRVVVNFTTSTGIAIQGGVSIGSGLGLVTFQKHNRDDWNGIAAFSANLTLTNFAVSGVSRFLSVFGNNSKISIDTCSKTENVQTFIHTDALNGEMRLFVENSTITTQSASFYFRTNKSIVLNISIKYSDIKSESLVLDVRDTNNWRSRRQINVNIDNSSFYSGRDWLFYLSNCFSHISCKITNSFFSTYRYSNTIFLQSPSIFLTADGNTFSDTQRGTQIQFCEHVDEIGNFSKVVDIKNNIFNSSVDGDDIYFYSWYTRTDSHDFNMFNNVFHHRMANRQGAVLYGREYSSYDVHSLNVESNTFAYIKGRVFYISFGLDRLVLKNNTFRNNKQCIYLSGSRNQDQKLNGLEILNNIFANNSHSDGVVFIDRQDVGIYRANVSFNSFENNTGSILTFRSSDIQISFNMFENENSIYDLKIATPIEGLNRAVNATLNYWGTYSFKEIARKIYDKNYDDQLLDVIFSPFLGSRNISDIQEEDASFVAGSEIGGQINGNVTLRSKGIPYVAASNIEVGENDTLIVEAGVEIRAKPNIAVHVLGKIQVLGSEERQVKIYPDVSGLPWKGIVIDTSKDTIIRYLIMDGTQQGLKIRGNFINLHNITSINSKASGITIDMTGVDTSLNFTQLISANNSANGIYISATATARRGIDSSDLNSKEVTVYISQCAVDQNTLHGIEIESNVKVEITNCSIKNNGKIGVRIQSYQNGSILVYNSIISNNSERAILAYLTKGIAIQSSIIRDHNYGYRTYWNYWSTREYIVLYKQSSFQNTTVLIKDSKFINNIANGIRFDSYYYVGGSNKVVIEGNVFSGGNRTLVVSNNAYNYLSFEMNANSIEDNIQIDNRQSDKLLDFNLETFKEFIMRNNHFKNNTADTCICLANTQSSNSSCDIRQNTFLDNNISSTVLDISNIIPGQCSLNFNVFDSRYPAECIIKAPKFDLSLNINATHNYWGTNAFQQIVERICDFQKDMGKSFVSYLPYYEDEGLASLSQDEQPAFNISGVYGGEILQDLLITRYMFPMESLIRRSLIIRRGASVVIESGVVLKFAANRGVYVLGKIQVLGSEELQVQMYPEVSGLSWRGIVIDTSPETILRYLILDGTMLGLNIQGRFLDMHNVTSIYSKASGFTIDVTGVDNSLNLSQLFSANNSANGIYISGTATSKRGIDSIDLNTMEVTVQISQCAVDQNTLHGIEIESNVKVEITNCSIKNNGKIGVKFRSYENGSMSINHSIISNNLERAILADLTKGIVIRSSIIMNHKYGYRTYWNYWSTWEYIVLRRQTSFEKNTTVLIKDSKFIDNIANGIRFEFYDNYYYYYLNRGNTKVIIEGNVFSGGNRTLVLTKIPNNKMYLSFDMNTNIVENNTQIENMQTDKLLEFYLGTSSDFSMRNNRIKNNMADTCVLLAYPESDYSTFNIQENRFLDNNISSTLIDISNTMPLQCSLKLNIFKSRYPTECIIKAPKFDLSFNINATLTYWGTNALQQIVERVCDFQKHMELSFISYLPYYEDEGLTTLSRSAFNVSGVYGGEISQDLHITSSLFPWELLIGRSILIRRDVSVSIASGVVLKFAANRGVYVQGSLKTFSGSEPVRFENSADAKWFGLVFNSTQNDISSIYNAKIYNATNGLIAYSPHLEVRKSDIVNSMGNCLTIYQDLETKVYDFEMSKFANCFKNGLFLKGSGNTSILNAAFYNVSTGVSLTATQGTFEMRLCNVTNSTEEAISVVFSDIYHSGGITIEHCIITESKKGMLLQTHNCNQENSIKVSRNQFTNVKTNAFYISFPASKSSWCQNNYRTVIIDINTFQSSCGIYLETWNNANLTFKDNVLSNANCITESACYIFAYANGNGVERKRYFDISTNVVQNITSNCIVHLKTNSWDNLIDGTFTYNQIISNKATNGGVLVDAWRFNISKNIFDNPLTYFDVYTILKGSHFVNVTNNWWRSSDVNEVYNRIYDQRRDPSFIFFNVTPVLTERMVDCSGVNNCSLHGECVSPNRCRCNSGWSGTSCLEYDCAGVSGCYGNGKCVGPNKCECFDGWSGSLCIVASCKNVNNCSNHGICVRPDVCTCASKFTGSNCSSCAPLHWGSECRPCPGCKHGQCDLQSGTCICDSNNWSGNLCDICSDTFYGPNCLPLIKVLQVMPNEGSDKGNNSVHVLGHNFPQTSNNVYLCKFGNSISYGLWLAKEHVVCTAPPQLEGLVVLEISPDGYTFTNDKLTYFYYATCPPGACGQSFSPKRGHCLFGGCSCFSPWTGDNCNTELLAPAITDPVPEETVTESANYTLQLSLNQGAQPIRWSIMKGPNSLTVDERTGLVTWKNVFASASAYQIEVRASNAIGQDTVAWSLFVPLSYTVELTRFEGPDVLPIPRPVDIYGSIVFSTNVSARAVPIDVIVTSIRTGKETRIQALSDSPPSATFKTRYLPRPNDAGSFLVQSRHPGTSEFTGKNLTWSVLGIQCYPSTASVWEIISDDGRVIIKNLSALMNIGDRPVVNISSQISSLPDALIQISGGNDNASFFLRTLDITDVVNFDLVIRNARPLSGTFDVLFSSYDGTSTRLRVGISLSVQKPNLLCSPSSMNEYIVRGTQKFLHIKVTNTGEVKAQNVKVSLPKDDRLSLVSFSSVGTNVSENYDSAIAPITIALGGTAQISLAVTTSSTEALGEMRGTIYINSEYTSTPLPYTFYIVSIQKFNVTFTVKDEYTYFAAGSPLVSNAKVQLVNPRRGYSETKFTTNKTGIVIFEDLFEDQYTLYSEADGHSSYSAVILVTPEKTKHDIFLQRIAVKYTWTVTPTTVEDKYIISLESTFETYVPMPVVTIEPAKVNTIPLELEETGTILFVITNYGLIRADNIRFNLPTGHPYLKFESTIDFIGGVEANTSIIVPIKFELKTRVKRDVVAMATCGLAVLYDYVCGVKQTRYLDVTLTREYPGKPPLPCGLIGGGGGSVGGGGFGYVGGGNGQGGGSGSGVNNDEERESSGGGAISYTVNNEKTGSGSSLTYNPSTPLSCDCAKSLIKDCALGFHPIAGCIMPLVESGNDIAESGGNAMKIAKDVLDIAFSCGLMGNFLGTLHSTVGCLGNVQENCMGNRKKRDISSEVVNNMLSSAKPLSNFLSMMSEILGDEAMYNLNDSWYQAFKKSIGDDTDLGTRLSGNEAYTVLNASKDDASKTSISKFLERWNNTAAAWENGTLTELENTNRVISFSRLTPNFKQYLFDKNSTFARGFSSIIDEFDYATNAYKTAETSGGSKDEGVCAKVRVRIVQELVLTRDAFNARLEIENGENSDLENIKVEIQIRQTYGSGDLLNSKFSIGSPMLIGISGVDGLGRLGMALSGSAEWLIIPYSDAAPQDDVLYDIGGRLSYSVGGSEFSISLLPDTITVKPNPSLVVHYFHDKYVRGDDALTPEIEPVVPFSLAVLVMNNGYGVTRALRITSGQPEIVENTKGSLVAFKIINAQLRNDPITPSLTVNFGDIYSFETKTARWFMTSSLAGTFYNYTANFENINPLGDPQLSLIDKLGYHELIQFVRIQSDRDDELDDFLVNDEVDQDEIPDKLYNSANGTDVLDVYSVNFTDIVISYVVSNKNYTHVRLSVNTLPARWFYCRTENTFTSSKPSDNEYLLYAEAEDGRSLFVDKNVWQTTHILDKFYLHLLDFISNQDTNVEPTKIHFEYLLIYGPRNMYPPKFNSSAFSVSVSHISYVGFEIMTLYAYDIDNDDLSFKLQPDSNSSIVVRQKSNTSAAIVVDKIPLKLGTVTYELIVEDKGIPSQSSSVSLTISVTDSDFTTTSPSVTSATSSSTYFNETSTTPQVKVNSTSVSSSVSLTTSVTDSDFSTNSSSVTSAAALSTSLSTNFNETSTTPQVKVNSTSVSVTKPSPYTTTEVSNSSSAVSTDSQYTFSISTTSVATLKTTSPKATLSDSTTLSSKNNFSSSTSPSSLLLFILFFIASI